VGNQGTLSSALHHIAARRGGRLNRSSTSLAGVDGLVTEEEEEEQGREGRMQWSSSNGHGMDQAGMAPGAVSCTSWIGCGSHYVRWTRGGSHV
jgi:hypothetical protein